MGYQVYWSNDRWQGYGVPAFCDYPGCKEEIDRGMGYAHDRDETPPSIFTCEKHKFEDSESFEIDLEKELPEWLNHVLTDSTWEEWRKSEPEKVEEYRKLLNG
jgi:hypothetical protein